MATGLCRANAVVGAYVWMGTGGDDLDAVVGQKLVKSRILDTRYAVLLHQPRRFARRAIVDAHQLGQRMIAKRLDIFAGHPTRSDQTNAIFAVHRFPLPCYASVEVPPNRTRISGRG